MLNIKILQKSLSDKIFHLGKTACLTLLLPQYLIRPKQSPSARIGPDQTRNDFEALHRQAKPQKSQYGRKAIIQHC